MIPASLAASPAETVSTYHDQLLQSVRDSAGKTDMARFTSLAPAMDAAFDFESMIKTAAGTHWGKASAESQRALLDAFRRVSIATYADQFAGLTSGAFIIKGSRNGPRGLKLVDCELKTGDENVAISYVVRNKNGDWLIVDVLLKGGISELALRASEYASTLKKGGAEALARTLNEQATALLAH
ncbi:ABC transporter substrate-binding protein [Thalassospiraceae bacterium LMO-JJ14]|nr:ABC transporter substrate-binding protein [Thalassospiraceae bacterium LMO-JJ14]